MRFTKGCRVGRRSSIFFAFLFAAFSLSFPKDGKVIRIKEAKRKDRIIRVYDPSGRLVYQGKEEGFNPRKRGVFFIYKDGKIKKEVVR